MKKPEAAGVDLQKEVLYLKRDGVTTPVAIQLVTMRATIARLLEAAGSERESSRDAKAEAARVLIELAYFAAKGREILGLALDEERRAVFDRAFNEAAQGLAAVGIETLAPPPPDGV